LILKKEHEEKIEKSKKDLHLKIDLKKLQVSKKLT